MELCNYGGSAMMLAYSSRETTKDVDAIVRPSEVALRLVQDVAQQLGLHESWLNDDVKQFVSDAGTFAPLRIEELEGAARRHLKITRPSASYLLAMKSGIIRRPTSLQEVAVESGAYAEFGRNLKDFLHEFAFAKKRGLALEPLLSEEPPRLAGRFEQGRICDAFLAATADYLSRVNGIQTPVWALKQDRVLEEPWFSEELPKVRLLLLRDTPSAFKDKNVFVFDSALKVA